VARLTLRNAHARRLSGPAALALQGRHVLVTGGSSGIGEAVAVLCVSQGAKVTLVARRPAEPTSLSLSHTQPALNSFSLPRHKTVASPLTLPNPNQPQP
jgi:NAD(P)-dependent dehydrogenase (short-subunit alcohol dehydrogenase family)